MVTRAPQVTTTALPERRVVLRLDAPTTRGAWTFAVRNEGDVPVRLVADGRLLSLELFPRSVRTPVRCELPSTMRPDDALERAVILPPQRTFIERIEPRLYCFGRAAFDALAAGTVVIAHLGFGDRGSKPPYVVAPIDGVEPIVSGIKTLDAAPIALPDLESPREHGPHAPPGVDAPHVALTGPSAVDGTSPETVEIPLRLRNDGSSPVTLRFRPETVGFDVTAPQSGLFERCTWPAAPSAPVLELYRTLPPHTDTELTLVLDAYCMGRILDRAGLLVVRPWLDTRATSGASVGLRTAEGRWVAAEPSFVRMQRGRVQEPLVRPRLQEP